jgi:lysophospholipase L1-like esterase
MVAVDPPSVGAFPAGGRSRTGEQVVSQGFLQLPRYDSSQVMRRFSLPPALIAAALLTLTACDHFAAAQATASAQPQLTPAPPTDPCRVQLDPASTIRVETLRAADGSCVPPSNLVVYRCDPSVDPPVAVADVAGVRRRFLGGSYAVPLASLPTDALPVGIAEIGRIWTTRDSRQLYVEAGGRIERWLSLPADGALSNPPTAFMLGDSILDGGQADIVARLSDWNVTVDAVIGRSSSGGITPAESFLTTPNVVVVELGVNDVDAESFAANAQRILTAVGSAHLVVWVTAHGPEPVTDQVNRAIVTMMGSIPNGAILDWDRLVPPELLGSDGVHPTSGQEGLLGSFLVPFLQTWRDAASGRGPTRCEGDVSNAVHG